MVGGGREESGLTGSLEEVTTVGVEERKTQNPEYVSRIPLYLR